jgi:hypothetical protein
MKLQQIQISSTSTGHLEGFGQGIVTLPLLQISAHGSGDIVSPPMPPSRIISPPPPRSLEIDVSDSIQLDDSAKTGHPAPWWRQVWLIVKVAGQVAKKILDLQQRLAAWVQSIWFWIFLGTAVNWQALKDWFVRSFLGD